MNALARGSQIFGVFGRQIRKYHVPCLLIESNAQRDGFVKVRVCDHVSQRIFNTRLAWLTKIRRQLLY